MKALIWASLVLAMLGVVVAIFVWPLMKILLAATAFALIGMMVITIWTMLSTKWKKKIRKRWHAWIIRRRWLNEAKEKQNKPSEELASAFTKSAMWKLLIALIPFALFTGTIYLLATLQYPFGNNNLGNNILWWIGIIVCLFIGLLLSVVSLLIRVHEKRIDEEKREGAHKVATVMFCFGAILTIAGLGLLFRNFVTEGYQMALDNSKVSLGPFWKSWQQEISFVGIGILVLIILAVTGKFLSKRSDVPKYLRVVLGIVAAFTLLHLFVWLYWSNSNVYMEWVENPELFWVSNAGLLVVVFLFLSGLPFGKILGSLLALIVITGVSSHFPWDKLPKQETTATPAHQSTDHSTHEKWSAVCTPKHGGPPYTLEIRNVDEAGNRLTYDFWSSRGKGKIGEAVLSRENPAENYYGRSTRYDTGNTGKVWLKPDGYGYRGEASWMEGGKEVRVDLKLIPDKPKTR